MIKFLNIISDAEFQWQVSRWKPVLNYLNPFPKSGRTQINSFEIFRTHLGHLKLIFSLKVAHMNPKHVTAKINIKNFKSPILRETKVKK